MKKLILFTLLFLGLCCTPVFGETKHQANPANIKVLLDGEEVLFGAYNIYDYHYFKLRDLAMALRGTDKGINIGWYGTSLNLYPSYSDSKEEYIYINL